MIEEANALVKNSVGAVRILGAVTVAFFILLFAFIFIAYFHGEETLAAVTRQGDKIDSLDKKIDETDREAKNDRALAAYFLKQICYHGAKTELEMTSCNPSPSLLQANSAL